MLPPVSHILCSDAYTDIKKKKLVVKKTCINN